MAYWKTSRRQIPLERPLVMGILNVTPDSFSDGGQFTDIDSAIAQAERMMAAGADIIDIGGESTRPGSKAVAADEEIRRVIPVIEALSKRFAVPISVDTTKADIARRAIDSGAEIVNDISGLRWDESLANVAAATGVGIVLMHSRGTFEAMHSQLPVDDILAEVASGLGRSIEVARSHGVAEDQIVLDPGIGFGKTHEQNLELLAKLDNIVAEFEKFPILVGTSRKSFIGRSMGDVPPTMRLGGSLSTALLAIRKGAMILRVHDVVETVSVLSVSR